MAKVYFTEAEDALQIKIRKLDLQEEVYWLLRACADDLGTNWKETTLNIKACKEQFGLSDEDIEIYKEIYNGKYFMTDHLYASEPFIKQKIRPFDDAKEKLYKDIISFVNDNGVLLSNGISEIYDNFICSNMPSLYNMFKGDNKSQLNIIVQSVPFTDEYGWWDQIEICLKDCKDNIEKPLIFNIVKRIVNYSYTILRRKGVYIWQEYNIDDTDLFNALTNDQVIDKYIIPTLILNSKLVKFADKLVDNSEDPQYLQNLDKLDNYYKQCTSKPKGYFMLTAPQFIEDMLKEEKLKTKNVVSLAL